MTASRTEERRSEGSDRRDLDMDRRQFINISWTEDKERRLKVDDRRSQEGDRRG